MKTIYITKYCLTQGILEKEAEITDNGLARIKGMQNELYHEGQFYFTMKEAVSRAKQLRSAKISAMYKSVDKLQKLVF